MGVLRGAAMSGDAAMSKPFSKKIFVLKPNVARRVFILPGNDVFSSLVCEDMTPERVACGAGGK